jgi:hypothetical protein
VPWGASNTEHRHRQLLPQYASHCLRELYSHFVGRVAGSPWLRGPPSSAQAAFAVRGAKHPLGRMTASTPSDNVTAVFTTPIEQQVKQLLDDNTLSEEALAAALERLIREHGQKPAGTPCCIGRNPKRPGLSPLRTRSVAMMTEADKPNRSSCSGANSVGGVSRARGAPTLRDGREHNDACLG